MRRRRFTRSRRSFGLRRRSFRGRRVMRSRRRGGPLKIGYRM